MDGKTIYALVSELFPICRSITGNGNRKTLKVLSEICPMEIKEVPSGTRAFDWTVPDEWNIDDAYIENEQHKKIIDFKQNNLYVVGYSEPVDQWVELQRLKAHIYTLPDQPDVIPYVTSYYKKKYGFCMSHNQYMALTEGKYHMVIKSRLESGSLTYGEIFIEGKTEREVFLSTYICHPSMANNELSGPCVTIYLAKWIQEKLKERRYSYRIIFIPETIGSIVYLSENFASMKKNIIAGFNVTCVGDNFEYSYLASRYGNTLADKIAMNILDHMFGGGYKKYTFLERGSDERQYCAPGVDLPVCSIMRTKYGMYPEYHTSADNLNFISPDGLAGSFDVLTRCLAGLESNKIYKVTNLCEPQLGKRNLYPTDSVKGSALNTRSMMNFLAYADGNNDLLDISNMINVPIEKLYPIVNTLLNNNLIEEVEGK